jgi:hypothetical protein
MNENKKSYYPKGTILPKGIYLFAEDKNSDGTPPQRQLEGFVGRDQSQRDINGHPYCIFEEFNSKNRRSVSIGTINATLNNQNVVREVQKRNASVENHLHPDDRKLLQKTFNQEAFKPTRYERFKIASLIKATKVPFSRIKEDLSWKKHNKHVEKARAAIASPPTREAA